MTAPSKRTKAQLLQIIERKDEALNRLERNHKATFCIDDPGCLYCEWFRDAREAS